MKALGLAVTVAAALLGASEARAQCNTSGTSTGCDSAFPYSCAASTICHATYPGCTADAACGGGTASNCNTGGTATGCTVANPFSCPASTSCWASYSSCLGDATCSTGGGGGGTGPRWGCNAGLGFSPLLGLLLLVPARRRRRSARAR